MAEPVRSQIEESATQVVDPPPAPLESQDGEFGLLDLPVPRQLPFSTTLLQLRSRNVWSHLLRDLLRFSVLVIADVGVFLTLRFAIRVVREVAPLTGIGSAVASLFPPGFLGGWQFVIALVLALSLVGSYGAGDARRDETKLLAAAAFASVIALYGSLWVVPVPLVLMRAIAVTAVFGTSLMLSRAVVDALVWRARPRIGVSRAVVVAHSDADWQDLASILERVRDFVVVRTLNLDDHSGRGVHPRLAQLGPTIEATGAQTVLLWGNLTEQEFSIAVDTAAVSGCRLLAGARTSLGDVQPHGIWMGGRQLVELTPRRLRGWQIALKRTLDLVGASVGLTLMAPAMIVIWVLVRLESPGPSLFAQPRLGASGRTFSCFKFRTMRMDAEQDLRANAALYERYVENDFKLPEAEDPRITRVGRFLRKTSLDELPQLLNVLTGDMSLVGPRPIVPAELDNYGGGASLFLSLKPGMTGQWAVSGRSEVAYPERARMELAYIRTWSLLSDLSILARTVPAVLRRRGAH